MPRPPRRWERGPTRPSPHPGPRGGGPAFSSSLLPPCPQPPLLAFPSRSFPVALLSWSLSPLPRPLSSCLPRRARPSPYSRPLALSSQPSLGPHSGRAGRARGSSASTTASPAPLSSFLLFLPSPCSSVDSLLQPVCPCSFFPLPSGACAPFLFLLPWLSGSLPYSQRRVKGHRCYSSGNWKLWEEGVAW